jgi:HSP20 family protein
MDDCMAMITWRRPGEELARIERRMRRLFDEPLRLDLLPEEMAWMPAAQVVENERTIEVTAGLSGMTADDIEVNLQNNVLAIRGEKKEKNREAEKEPFLYERYYGSFQRAFPCRPRWTRVRSMPTSGTVF